MNNKTSTCTDNEPTITWVIEAKFKELTDKEIDELADQYLKYQIECSGPSGVYEFARAVLKKAQAKK